MRLNFLPSCTLRYNNFQNVDQNNTVYRKYDILKLHILLNTLFTILYLPEIKIIFILLCKKACRKHFLFKLFARKHHHQPLSLQSHKNIIKARVAPHFEVATKKKQFILSLTQSKSYLNKLMLFLHKTLYPTD